MKAGRILALVLAMLLLCSGCSGKTESDRSSEADAVKKLVTLPDGAKRLSKSELSELNAWFAEDTIRGRFLRSTYETPADADLFEVFYYGCGEDRECTLDDIRAFLAQYGWWGTFTADCSSKKEMDQVLTELAGLSLSDTNRVHLGGLYYVSRLSKYISLHGDVEQVTPELLFGYREDGTVSAYYQITDGTSAAMNGVFRVTLTECGSGYQFEKNQRCDNTSGALQYTTSVYSESTNETEQVMEDTYDQLTLSADKALSRESAEAARTAICGQSGFEEQTLTGQSWTDISEFGSLIAGTLDGNLCMYYAANDGTVYPLPTFAETVSESDVTIGGGGQVLMYVIEKITDQHVTDHYGTLLLPTTELFYRTVKN